MSSITGTHSFRVHQLVSTQDYSPTHLSPTLNANGDISLFSHLYPNSPDTIPAVRLMLGPLHIGGTIEVTGGVGVFGGLSGEGTIHLNNWSAIEMPGDHHLS
ncbi:MAG TPA: hypothetical protein PK402_10465, partial [Tepidisphaeraceae bacterium]|nr:hypothetical protein [Tepidisphaeraceae bacterium]